MYVHVCLCPVLDAICTALQGPCHMYTTHCVTDTYKAMISLLSQKSGNYYSSQNQILPILRPFTFTSSRPFTALYQLEDIYP